MNMKIEYRYEDMMQFQCVFKDGTKDYVDPVKTLEETDTQVLVNNWCFPEPYVYEKADLEYWEILE